MEQDSKKAQAGHIPKDGVVEDPNVVEFDGPDDPENPLNWSSTKKATQIILVTSMSLLSPIGSTINASSTLAILKNFNSSNQTAGALVTTVFLLGYTFGPIMIAPLSELYGRAILYNTCMFLFIICNILCALANSLGSLIVYRFLSGIAGSCPVTLGPGSITDMLTSEKRTGPMGAYIIVSILGPNIGVVAGGYFAAAAGWRWDFWLIVIVCSVLTLLSVLFLCESNPYVLLEHKARHLRKRTRNMALQSTLHTGKTSRDLFTFSITRPLKMLMSPIVFSLSLYTATVCSYLYLCFTTFETVFHDQYGFSSGETGLATLGMGAGCVFGCVACGLLTTTVSKWLTKMHGGNSKPEYQLISMILGGVCTPIGLFWYGWSAHAKLHWMVPIMGAVFIGIGMIFTYVSLTLLVLD